MNKLFLVALVSADWDNTLLFSSPELKVQTWHKAFFGEGDSIQFVSFF